MGCDLGFCGGQFEILLGCSLGCVVVDLRILDCCSDRGCRLHCSGLVAILNVTVVVGCRYRYW